MIKPDGVQRRVVGDIISRFESKGYLLKGLKLTTPSKETLETHYQDLKGKGTHLPQYKQFAQYASLIVPDPVFTVSHLCTLLSLPCPSTPLPCHLCAPHSYTHTYMSYVLFLLPSALYPMPCIGFFPKLMDYMGSGPVVAMVWEGKNVVKTGRQMLGATNPADSAPGTIRGDFALDVGRNICHGSDSVESAEREIALWFGEGLNEYDSHSSGWIYE
jgi:nucleoside diphosphate kinase